VATGRSLERNLPERRTPGTTTGKAPWSSFEIRNLGRISDLVEGGGKTGVNVDGDPQVAFKGGVG
jgi:hypothetical protein